MQEIGAFTALENRLIRKIDGNGSAG